MGLHDINNNVSAELREIVRADHRINRAFVAYPDLICPRLIFQQFIEVNAHFQSPLHLSNETYQLEALCLGFLTTFSNKANVLCGSNCPPFRWVFVQSRSSNWSFFCTAATSIPADSNRWMCSSHRLGSMVWTAFSPHSRPSRINGSSTR